MAQTNVNFEVEIHVVIRGDNLYAATIMPFHVTGYGDTFDSSIDRAKEGLEHLLRAYEDEGNLEAFLDESGIEYTLADEAPAVDGSVRRVRETDSVCWIALALPRSSRPSGDSAFQFTRPQTIGPSFASSIQAPDTGP